jgi:hypothetical protein
VEAQDKGAACPNERHAKNDRLCETVGAGVQLPKLKSGAYRVKGELARRARPQGELAREHCSA